MSRGQPPTPPGTHGKISYRTAPSGNTVAYTRLRLYTGKIAQVTATGKSKSAATRALERRCTEKLGTPYAETITPATKLTTLIDLWLNQHDVTTHSKTIYTGVIRAHITPGIGELRLSELSPVVLQAFISQLTPGTAKTTATVLSSALKYAVRVGGLATSPWQAIRLPKTDRKPVTNITQHQQDEYIAAIKRWCTGLDPHQGDDETPAGHKRGHGLPQIIRVIAGSGLRSSEALGLRIQDVDPANRRITVTGQADSSGQRTDRIKNHASQFARRTITVTADAAAAIQEQLDSEPVQFWGEPLFPSRAGTYITVRNLNRWLRQATEGLDFGAEITPRAFRSTVSSRISATYGIDAAQRQLGHAKRTTTEAYYTAPPAVIDDYLGRLEAEGG
ncbi:site-specific integrase [Corynebacterium macclintockiae]|uniref:site-specific integrase n=1 Tax=Corynebacterium macclintockiae TaxID=2913501 RepID=UPI003EBBC345